MTTNGCAHDRFHENSWQETVCADCGLPWEEAVRKWLAAVSRHVSIEEDV